jgi:hypothetical protein
MRIFGLPGICGPRGRNKRACGSCATGFAHSASCCKERIIATSGWMTDHQLAAGSLMHLSAHRGKHRHSFITTGSFERHSHTLRVITGRVSLKTWKTRHGVPDTRTPVCLWVYRTEIGAGL